LVEAEGISRPPFFAAAICPVLVALRSQRSGTGRKQANRSARNAPSEILRGAQDDGTFAAKLFSL
jgi:hypothetical protein